MSLINDALKRANQQQPATKATDTVAGGAGAPMRPVERRPSPGSSSSAVLILLIVLILVVAGLLFYIAGRTSTLKPDSSAQTAHAVPVPTTPQIAPPSSPPPVTALTPTPTVTVTSLPPVAVTNDIPAIPSLTIVTAAVPVIAQVVVVTNPPPAVPLRLQGIFYRPARPSAFISGKTVFVGDRVGDARVLSITETNVSLLQGSQTNVLSLAD